MTKNKKNNPPQPKKPPQPTMRTPSPQPTLYLAYGSNLSHHQMTLRCPSSTYIGTARLPNHTWFINSRGYANIAPRRDSHVWGLVYTLTAADEAQLDRNEGVPVAYTKECMECDVFPCSSSLLSSLAVEEEVEEGEGEQRQRGGEKRRVLVYIDRIRATPGYAPRDEYVGRMNRGIADAVARGVPRAYVEGVLRRYIPEGEGEEGDKGGKGRRGNRRGGLGRRRGG